MSQIMILGPEEEDGFRSSMTVSLEPAYDEETTWDFAERILPGLQQLSSDFEVVDQKAVTFGSKQGVLREHHFTVRGAHISQLQFYVLRGGTGFTFTYTQRAELLSETRELAEALFTQARVGGEEEGMRLSFIRA